MKTFKKYTVTSLMTLLLVAAETYAQEVNRQQLGIRLGGIHSAITYKYIYASNLAYEIHAGTHNSGGGYFALLAEKNVPMDNNFEAFFGAGVFVANRFYRDEIVYFYDGRPGRYYYFDRPFVGIQLAGGIEYNFSQIPLSTGLDFRPEISYLGNPFFLDFGINLRYNF